MTDACQVVVTVAPLLLFPLLGALFFFAGVWFASNLGKPK